MPISNDKSLYKLLAGIVFAVSIPLIAMAWAAGGIKAALFGVWIIFGIAVFGLIIALSITSPSIGSSSKSIVARAAGGLFSYHSYRFLLFLLAFLMVTLSVWVWTYLDRRFPAVSNQNVPVSEIPNPREKW